MFRHASVNRIYRLVWSHASNSWVPAAETSRGRKKGSSKTLLATALSLCAGITEAGPLGGQVVSGSGHIGQAGAQTTVTQTSPVLSLSWASFNIAPQETVNFVQPSASAIAVNRITGSNGTHILGHLNANGQVYLINPNGILFGRSAQVNVGGLVASTIDVNDASLGGDARAFSGTGSGSIVNEGTINAFGAGNSTGGGYAALLGNRVSNQGTITARLGTVALGAGSAATLTFQGDSLVHFQVDRSVLDSVAANGGLIRADGGQVLMSAGAKDALLASVVNNTGIIEARTVKEHAGKITLLGGMAAGTVNVAGTLDASAPDGGNGGFIETSAAHVEVANSAKITTVAASGLTGSWLIDPQDFTVAGSGGDITGAALSGNLATTDATLQSSGGTTAGSGNVNINDPVSWSANHTLTLTASNNVNINANVTASGNTAGLVISPNTANGSETASGTGSFRLGSGTTINLTGSAPSLSIAGANYVVINSLGSAGSTTGMDLQGANGNLAARYALGSNIAASPSATWNSGAGFMPIGTSATPFTGTFDGLGHTISNLSINRTSIYYVGLFGEVGTAGIVRNTGMLVGSVHGGGYYDGILVGRNLGSISNSYTTGSLSGTSNSIGGLVGGNNATGTVSNSYSTATITGANNTGGLVGINYGSISNSYATGAVNGGYDVGGLIGFNRTGTATNVYSTGAVNGIANIGGLAGQNNATVSNSYATGNAHGSGATIAGLAGNNYGTVSNSYATGTVTGSSNLGGVAIGGTVNNSFWNITTSGLATSTRGTGLTTAQMRNAANFNGFGFTTTPASPGNAWVMVDADGSLNNAAGVLGATFPMLASEYSISISNTHQLQLMAMTSSANYTLATNIDASATAAARSAGSSDAWSTATGFVPIANFTGQFDGSGHTISNLTAIRTTDDVGLFGVAATGAVIGNVGLVGGNIAGANNVGALVGLNNGGTVANTYSTVSVMGTAAVGGLVGSNGGVIVNSYAVGGVSTTAGTSGGLVGANSGTISDSYAVGAPAGSTTQVGGLVGNNTGTLTSSVWNQTLEPLGVGAGAATGAIGLTTAGMMTTSNFSGAGWSIANAGGSNAVWRIYDGYTAPLLSGFLTPLTVTATNASTVFNGVGFSGNGVTYSATPNGNLLGTLTYGAAQGAIHAGSYAITPAGQYSNQQGYSITAVSATLTIAALPLTGTVAAGSSVYGAPLSPGAVTFTNVVTGHTAVTSPITITTAGNLSTSGHLKAGSYSGVESAGGTLSGIDAGDYTFAGAIGNYTVLKLALNGSIATGSSVYGAPLSAGAVTFANAIGNDGVTAVAAVSTTNHISTSSNFTAGTHTGSESVGSTLSGTDAGNYTFAGATGDYVVTPLALNGAIATGSSVYGSALTPGVVSVSNAIGGDNVTAGSATVSIINHISASGHFTAGTHTGSESVGSTLTGADAGNYTFAGASGDYIVTPLALTGSIATGNSIYGSALTPGAASVSNAISGDTVTAGTVMVSTTNHISTGGNFTAGTHTGSESVGSTLSGADAGNYTFAGATGDYVVSPLALNGAIATGSSVYGSALTPGAVSFSNASVGDNITAGAVAVSTANNTSTSSNFTAGTHTGSESVGSTLSGTDAGNYTFAGATGDYVVTPLALNGAIATGSSVYGSALTPGVVSVSNAIGGDNVTAGSATVSIINHISASGHFTAGTHTGSESVGSTLTGADAGNYTFAGASGDYIVTPLALTGSIATGNSIYGSALTPGAASVSNAISGDTVTAGTVMVSTTNHISTGGNFTAGTHTGSESVGSTLSGADAGNYTFAGATGDYVVSPLALNGAIATGSSVYGSALTPGAVSFSNASVGDVVTAGAVAVSTTNNTSTGGNFTAGTHTGSESVGSTLTGADAGNYTFSGATGNYTVSPLTLSVAATGVNKVYDGTTIAAPLLSSGGVLMGDQVNLIAGTANFAGKNVGNAQSVNASGITIQGADAADYTLNSTSATTTASISPASLTVSGVAAGNKVYDGTRGAILAGGSLIGVVAGDPGRVALIDAGSFVSLNAGTGIAVTAAETLSGDSAGNYVLVQPQGLVANITPATLTYDAAPARRTAGRSPTGLSGNLSGFVVGETRANDTAGTLAWTTPASASSRDGLYAIEGGGLTAANYVFVEAPGNATALALQPAAVAPPAALSAIGALQSTVLVSPPGSPSALNQIADRDTLSGNEGASNDSLRDEGPGADTQRIGNTKISLRIVRGGVRLPQ